MVDTKVCTKCGEEKSLSEYHKSKSGKFGTYCYCKKCVSAWKKLYYQLNREDKREYNKRYWIENRERELKKKKDHYQENRQALLKNAKKYYRKNRNRKLEYNKKYYQENKNQYRIRNRQREGVLKQQTPDWLTPIDNIIMKHIYATCPEGYHVDHIVPLKSDKVSGLNVPWNLQHLPAEENIAKGNRYWPDMWEYDDG